MSAPQIVWLRQDLRISDQPAFAAAAAAGPVIPVYILDDETPAHRRMGGASRWWLHHSLTSLSKELAARGSRLVLRRGRADAVLAELARETGASAIHALRHVEPWWRNAERSLRQLLPVHCALVRHDGQYLAPPGSIRTGAGTAFKIYTPFWRAMSATMPPSAPEPAPANLSAPSSWPLSEALEEWGLRPTRPDWSGGLAAMWQPGEGAAKQRLDEFVGRASRYDEQRNFPSRTGTSFLSPHLHFGEISVAQCWHATADCGGSVETFLKELVWRDYGANLVWQFPDYGSANAKAAFAELPWRDARQSDAAADLKAWQRGQTGYPIVDAGMRELWATGWMHNRVRMITASFLVKHLLIDWRVGEQWFWDTLVDADYGSNSTNWQWTAGSGVDANMFVRIMAPLTQSEKFDAGDYIRRWVPELVNIGDPWIHDPDAAGLRPAAYPAKIVDHRFARERALAAHDVMKSAG